MRLRILGSLCSRAQAEKRMVTDQAEIARHRQQLILSFHGLGAQSGLALPRGSLFQPASGFSFNSIEP